MSDPWDSPEMQEWVDHVRKTLVPMLDNSLVSVSIAPPIGGADIKYAIELGLSILMEKPILLVVGTDRQIPAKLRMIADDIAYVDWSNPDSQRELAEVVQRFAARYAED